MTQLIDAPTFDPGVDGARPGPTGAVVLRRRALRRPAYGGRRGSGNNGPRPPSSAGSAMAPNCLFAYFERVHNGTE
jgi:hypothetical protein